MRERGFCPACDKDVSVTRAGLLRHHTNGVRHDGLPWADVCSGSGHLPNGYVDPAPVVSSTPREASDADQP